MSFSFSSSRFSRVAPFFARVTLLSAMLLVGLSAIEELSAQEQEVTPVGRLIPLESPLSDEALGLVRRTALELQSIAETEDRKTYLFLEIKPGITEFHNAFAMAEFLTASAIQNVTTVAWVSETVTGNNALVALACKEIVMSPKAKLGDLGRGKAVAEDRQGIVLAIVAKRRNARVTTPLAKAMLDPAVSLVNVTIETENGERETRLATADEASALLDSGAVIQKKTTIKEPGTPGIFSGEDAQRYQMLATQIANTRNEVADAFQLPVESLRELSAPDAETNVAYIQLHDEIDRVFHSFALSQIDRAVAQGAKTIIFEVDTPGGLLDVCIDLSSRIIRLNESGIRTIAYIPNQAISGGAIISVACSEIYMQPDAKIGDAMPISLTIGGGFVHADPKILSVLLEHMRMLAEKTGRPTVLVEGFCDAKLEAFEVTNKTSGRKWFMSEDEIHKSNGEWIKGPRVPESRPEVAVFVNGRRAHELKLASAPVENVEELKERLGIPLSMEFQVTERSWVDSLVFWLNNEWVTGMLFFLAIVCIYIEMATMTGFFGILAASAFGVFFWSRMLGGTASTLELSMFVLGLGCLAMEVFVIPGFGVFGVSGILMIVGSLVMASMTFSGFGVQYDMERVVVSFAPFAASLVGVIVFASFLGKYLPHIPVLNSMILTPPNVVPEDDEPRLRATSRLATSELVGSVGAAVSDLRPAGKARIDGRLYDVVSDGPYIQYDCDVEVVKVQGNRIVVREKTV
ncbi:NfeD family protein [Thalassoglobus sp.]|uniref:NfeD family protein n=1 Tax=Thalassoglobus sp. TaxID=2795869 RepID=UPI003AA97B8E